MAISCVGLLITLLHFQVGFRVFMTHKPESALNPKTPYVSSSPGLSKAGTHPAHEVVLLLRPPPPPAPPSNLRKKGALVYLTLKPKP